MGAFSTGSGRFTSTGIALPGVTFNKIAPATNVACPAGVFTSLTAPQSLLCSDAGQYLIFASGALYVLLGATPPSDIQFQLSSTPASNTDPHSILPYPIASAAANSTLVFPVMSVLAFVNPTVVPNPVFQPGQSFNFQVKPIGQAITVLGSLGPPVGGTQIPIFKFRRDD